MLSLQTDERGKQLVARDTGGKVLFYGYVNTLEQRRQVPEVIRPKLERLETPPRPQFAPASASPTGASRAD